MEDNLVQGKKFLEGIFDGIQDGISVLDKNLKILHVNHVMNKWYSHALPLTGKKCFQAYHGRSEPCVVCPTLRAIEKGTLQRDVVPFTGPQGKIGSQELFAFPFKDEKGNVTGVIEYVRDITEKKKMEEKIDSTTKVIQLLPEIAVATSEASTFDEAMQICIDKVCLLTGWDVGHVYLPDSKGSLFSTKLWFFRDFDLFETFRKITDKTVFTHGVGLIGKVFAKGKLIWLEDVTQEPYFLRTKSGEDINVRFGFAFPVMVDKKTVAVLEFFAEKSLRPDEYFLEAISTISAHLAWVYERRKSEELLQKQKKDLEFKNIALREVLGQVELDKKEIKDNVIANAENLLLPIIEKIRLKGESRKYINLLRKSLKELTSSFGAKLTEKETKLTSREIEVCNMIKNGLASLEIADLLNISLRTIEKHRAHIRKKLDISKKEVNLASFLKTL